MTAKAKRTTCDGCPHARIKPIPMGGKVASCDKTNHIVPHNGHRDKENPDYWVVEFTRVPMDCPLPDDEVEKREAP